jgi:hypothetical protein
MVINFTYFRILMFNVLITSVKVTDIMTRLECWIYIPLYHTAP